MVNDPAGSECAAPGPELRTSWARREDLDVAGTGRQRRQIAGFARQREPDFGAIWFKENVLGSNRRRHRTNVPRVKSDLRPLPPEWGDTRKADESEWGLHQI